MGRSLQLGPEVRLRVIGRAPRCSMTGMAQPDPHPAPRVLAHLARRAQAPFGVYASVLVPGRVSLGDMLA